MGAREAEGEYAMIRGWVGVREGRAVCGRMGWEGGCEKELGREWLARGQFGNGMEKKRGSEMM